MTGRVRLRGGVLSFRLRLTPKGGRDAIDGWARGADGEEYLKVRVATAPQDGKANAALLALLGTTLDIGKTTIRIADGQSARLKRIEISPATADIVARLKAMETAT